MTHRSFILDKSDVTVKGLKCKDEMPIKAAKKIAIKLFMNSKKRKIRFFIRETTKDSNKKTYHYVAEKVQSSKEACGYKVAVSPIKQMKIQRGHGPDDNNPFPNLLQFIRDIITYSNTANKSIQNNFQNIKDELSEIKKQIQKQLNAPNQFIIDKYTISDIYIRSSFIIFKLTKEKYAVLLTENTLKVQDETKYDGLYEMADKAQKNAEKNTSRYAKPSFQRGPLNAKDLPKLSANTQMPRAEHNANQDKANKTLFELNDNHTQAEKGQNQYYRQ